LDWQYTEALTLVRLYSARNSLPDSLLFNRVLRVRLLGDPADDDNWREVAIGGGRAVEGEFFICVQVPPQIADTVALVSDRGAWNNRHGLVFDGERWRTFDAGPHSAYNPLIYAVVEYDLP
jgi:hypothetical protein